MSTNPIVSEPIPFDQRDGTIWFNGDMVPWADSKIHVLTHGLHYGSCVFEGNRAYNGKIFKLHEHSERLGNSAQILGFDLPYSADELDAICAEVLAVNKLQDAYVRPVAWRGSEMMGVSAQQTRINVAVAAWEWPSYYDPAEKRRGIRLTHAQYRRPSPETIPCHAKASGLYMICTLSKHAAERDGYADALMLDWRGHIAETTGANVFFVRDGTLHTPTPDCFLNGITRRTVMALAAKRGWQTIERTILPAEIPDFSACFITGTAAEVTPVSQIGEHHFTPDNICLTLLDDYAALVRS